MILAILPMLMCTISLTIHKTMTMTVHNQHPDIELMSPVLFCNRENRYEYHVERDDDGAVIEIDLELDLDEPEGILMHKVQRNAGPNHRSIKVIEEALKMMQLLVTWKIEHSGEPKANIMLVEYDDKPVLNEDELAQLHDKVKDIPLSHNPSRLLMCDNTVLEVAYEAAQKEGLKLKIDIPQEYEGKDTIKLMWINSTRQVLFLIIIIYYY
jgi:hypothetical protein